MKKAISLIVAFVLCLSLCACGQDTPGTSATQNPGGSENTTPSTTQTTPTTPTQTDPKPLADFNILGEWIIADDGLTVITFNEDGTCVKEGEAAAKYKVDTEIAVLTIYYSTPKSYNIEKVDEHYHLTGEHILLHEADFECINLMRYELALALLNSIDTYFEFEQIAVMQEAYALLTVLGDYKDVPDILARFTECSLIITNHPTGQVWKQIYNMQGDSLVFFTDAPKYFINKYDNHGRLVYAECFDSAGKLIYYRTQEYNAVGQIIRQELTRENDITCYTYEYDASCDIVIRYYTDNGVLKSTTTTYYSNGLETKARIELSNSYQEVTYTYNENGLLIEQETFYSSSNSIARYTYEYDGCGNLIVEKKYSIYENGETTYSETTFAYSTVYIYTTPQS